MQDIFAENKTDKSASISLPLITLSRDKVFSIRQKIPTAGNRRLWEFQKGEDKYLTLSLVQSFHFHRKKQVGALFFRIMVVLTDFPALYILLEIFNIFSITSMIKYYCWFKFIHLRPQNRCSCSRAKRKVTKYELKKHITKQIFSVCYRIFLRYVRHGGGAWSKPPDGALFQFFPDCLDCDYRRYYDCHGAGERMGRTDCR